MNAINTFPWHQFGWLQQKVLAKSGSSFSQNTTKKSKNLPCKVWVDPCQSGRGPGSHGFFFFLWGLLYLHLFRGEKTWVKHTHSWPFIGHPYITLLINGKCSLCHFVSINVQKNSHAAKGLSRVPPYKWRAESTKQNQTAPKIFKKTDALAQDCTFKLFREDFEKLIQKIVNLHHGTPQCHPTKK